MNRIGLFTLKNEYAAIAKALIISDSGKDALLISFPGAITIITNDIKQIIIATHNLLNDIWLMNDMSFTNENFFNAIAKASIIKVKRPTCSDEHPT
ncbi:hypothetical protein MHTCC0001_11930 [Flavobacteriaceae bacterium MHTCC 0001]